MHPRGRGSAGRAQPCQGWGRGFEPRCPLHVNTGRSEMAGLFTRSRKDMAKWPSGKAEACKAFTTGSNPVFASIECKGHPPGCPFFFRVGFARLILFADYLCDLRKRSNAVEAAVLVLVFAIDDDRANAHVRRSSAVGFQMVAHMDAVRCGDAHPLHG